MKTMLSLAGLLAFFTLACHASESKNVCTEAMVEQLITGHQSSPKGACALPPEVSELVRFVIRDYDSSGEGDALLAAEKLEKALPYLEYCGGEKMFGEIVMITDMGERSKAVREMCGIEAWSVPEVMSSAVPELAVAVIKGWVLKVGHAWPEELQKRVGAWVLKTH